MKIRIGPYTGDLIPIHRWEKEYTSWRHNTLYIDEEDYDRIDKFVYWAFDRAADLFRPINRWSNNRRRKIKIHIDNYDVWSMDHTLAMIIVPMLKTLKEQKHGSPTVDPEDVPEELRPSVEPSDENGWVDDTHHERWTWVLDEMIWAFEQHASDDDTSQFHHNSDNMEMKFTKIEGTKWNTLDIVPKDPNKPLHFYDREAHMKHEDRKANGRRLFAKYYGGLWD